MVTRDAKEYPETISSEIQGGRPLHFLRVLSRIPLLEYGTKDVPRTSQPLRVREASLLGFFFGRPAA